MNHVAFLISGQHRSLATILSGCELLLARIRKFLDVEPLWFIGSPDQSALDAFNWHGARLVCNRQDIDPTIYHRNYHEPDIIKRVIWQWQSWNAALAAASDYINERDLMVTRALRIRTDLDLSKLHLTKISIVNPNTQKIFIPIYDDHGGYNDRFAIGHWPAIQHYHDLVNYFQYYYDHDNITFHAETMLHHHLQHFEIDRLQCGVELIR
jgi:hypothetical protein